MSSYTVALVSGLSTYDVMSAVTHVVRTADTA